MSNTAETRKCLNCGSALNGDSIPIGGDAPSAIYRVCDEDCKHDYLDQLEASKSQDESVAA